MRLTGEGDAAADADGSDEEEVDEEDDDTYEMKLSGGGIEIPGPLETHCPQDCGLLLGLLAAGSALDEDDDEEEGLAQDEAAVLVLDAIVAQIIHWRSLRDLANRQHLSMTDSIDRVRVINYSLIRHNNIDMKSVRELS